MSTRIVQLLYSSALPGTTFKCQEQLLVHNYYYEPIQINVVQSGNYTLSSFDSINGVVGVLYKGHLNNLENQDTFIAGNFSGCPKNEFKIIIELQSSVTYILFMTPMNESLRDDFSILVSGPNNITFNPISKSNIESIISSFSRYFH